MLATACHSTDLASLISLEQTELFPVADDLIEPPDPAAGDNPGALRYRIIRTRVLRISQSTLARVLGVNVRTIKIRESGAVHIRPEHLLALEAIARVQSTTRIDDVLKSGRQRLEMLASGAIL